jgi:hypothetical protein
MQKSPQNSAELSETYVKAKTTFIALLQKLRKYKKNLKLPMQIIVSSLLCVTFFCLLKRQGNGGKFGKR